MGRVGHAAPEHVRQKAAGPAHWGLGHLGLIDHGPQNKPQVADGAG